MHSKWRALPSRPIYTAPKGLAVEDASISISLNLSKDTYYIQKLATIY